MNLKRLARDWIKLLAAMYHAYPGLDIGKLSVARFWGLYEQIFSLPAMYVMPPNSDHIEKSLDQIESEDLVKSMAPDYKGV